MKIKGKMKSDIKVDGSGEMKMWKEWEMLKKVFKKKKKGVQFYKENFIYLYLIKTLYVSF